MGILPKILEIDENNIESNIVEEKKGYDTYIVDFKNKKVRYFNNKPVVDSLELATKMFIQKLLFTEIKKWRYHNNYGTNYVELTYGRKLKRIVTKIEIERNLKEQLLKYENIISVQNLKIKQEYKTLNIKFSVLLKNNNTLEWEEEIAI